MSPYIRVGSAPSNIAGAAVLIAVIAVIAELSITALAASEISHLLAS